MKDFKKIIRWTIAFIIFMAFFYLVIYLSGKFIFNSFSNDGRESFVAAITFFSVFATFGGAYLGAKISGESALKLKEKELYFLSKKEYIENNSKMLVDLEKNGFNLCKTDLQKMIENLSNEKEEIYFYVKEIKIIFEIVKDIENKVDFTDKLCEQKIREALKHIDHFNSDKWISNINDQLDREAIIRINYHLKDYRSSILKKAKKVEYILSSIPKYEINELETIRLR